MRSDLLLTTLAAAWLARRAAAAWTERRCAERLPVGAEGLVRGAAPIDLAGDPARAVLLVHGYGDTPQTLAYLAAHLHGRGWTVRAPLLPGHGRTLREFARSSAEEWIAHVRAELAALAARHETVALVGLSMGGALATIAAADAPRLSALVLVAPYLEMPPAVARLVRVHRVWGAVMPYVDGRGGMRSIHDAAERALNLAYGVSTPRTLGQLAAVVAAGQAAAPRLAVPTLLVQSREDNRIPPRAAERIFASLGAGRPRLEKRMEWVEGCGHIITVDYGRERVFAMVDEWLARPRPRVRPRGRGAG